MFDSPGPRVFGLPPGADFARELLIGLEQRLAGRPPEAWAEVEIYVNTRRMQRRLIALFNQGPARLLPRIRLVTELAQTSGLPGLPPAVPPLRRRLELARLVAELLRQQPDLAPSAASFGLADSLAVLMDEMQSEGVAPDALHHLDVSHLSAHWARTRSFLEIVERFFGADAQDGLDSGPRNRLAAERLSELWKTVPPRHPVIVAGSTGSRGATALLITAVAHLPQGAVVLPGFDFDMPGQAWDYLDDALTAEDHPQYRFRKLADMLATPPSAVRPWHDCVKVPNPARNRLISLALRPAPVTDQWLDEGQAMIGLAGATAGLTLIEAPSPRTEALAIALRLRKAAHAGVPAALITPDRMLTRQVTAALDRWGIVPDDSAGLPLQLSAPGRFLRHVAALFGQKLTVEALLALLKHPLTASTPGARGDHLRWTRELELHVRRHGPPFPTGDDLTRWAQLQTADDGRVGWAGWLSGLLRGQSEIGLCALTDHATRHIDLAEALSAGPGCDGTGGLWEQPAGIEARTAVDALLAEAAHGGAMLPNEYADLFRAVLSSHEVHDPISPHPGVMIWGTLEARVQGVDLVILGGLNEGTWPERPPLDPWLNREMRLKAGLLLPERRIGLAAHDFQQAIAAKEVVLSRAIRDAEAETVPSRWLNRLVNLLSGLDAQGGKAALSEMRARGSCWLTLGAALETQKPRQSPAPRPAPRPPVSSRPNQLSVTRIQTLIRDPYAIYAEYILRLKKLDPLRQEPSAAQRGSVLHTVLERFIRHGVSSDMAQAKADLLMIADDVFAEAAPWPAARRMWRAQLVRVADWFLQGEAERQALGKTVVLEGRGTITLRNGFVVTAKADRIDRLGSAGLVIYDYKTGTPPTLKQMETYDKQLLLEAAMAERGGFDGLRGEGVDHVAYIGLGSNPKVVLNPLSDRLVDQTILGLEALTEAFREHQRGYMARRAIFSRTIVTDYDHLSRFGEWDESQPAIARDVGA